MVRAPEEYSELQLCHPVFATNGVGDVRHQCLVRVAGGSLQTWSRRQRHDTYVMPMVLQFSTDEICFRHAVAGFTALIYDHILTFGDEVNYIWNNRMGLVSIIFLLNRYIVPLVLVVDIYESIGLAAKTTLFCKVWTVVQSYLTIASFMSIHAIVAWRVYALHGGQTWIGRFLWIAAVVYVSSSTVIITVALVPIISHLQPEYHECVGSIPPYLWAAWLPSVIFETLLFALTIVAMLRQEQRRSFSTLSLLLYRDGMLYFVAVTSEYRHSQ
ncbi:hypothetical protein AcV5_003217 [Taiwanofungus camphoratus]|nr:hypothetical protein AcV5_003217 [Antrodia cinnamomea]